MDAIGLLSFLEYGAVSGVARLGAGRYESVLSRPTSEPYLRLCCLEPPIGTVRLRARCGHAHVVPTGIEYVPEPDAMLRAGAWVQLLNLYVAVGRDLALEGARLAKAMPNGLCHHLWLACDNEPVDIRALTRDAALCRMHPSLGQVGALVVEAVGNAEEIERMFGAFRSSGDRGVGC